eukprot:Skav222797  [mRNA]  locus=scaffold1419:259379:260363:+ [translate_table: standard]
MPVEHLGVPVRVKNTFIDVEESPKESLWAAETSRRARSMPPPPMLETEDEEATNSSANTEEDEVSSPLSFAGTRYSASWTEFNHVQPSHLTVI